MTRKVPRAPFVLGAVARHRGYSNAINAIVGTPLDPVFQPQAWKARAPSR